MQYSAVCLVIVILIPAVQAVTHAETLMWTEKGEDGTVRIVGVPGPPRDWVYTGLPDIVGQSTPFDSLVRRHSSRIALGFHYATQKIFWSDRGFRQILRTQLQEQDETLYTYNATVNLVYSGISREVNGIAVDWLSGSIYWTDALYNWITVAAAQSNEIYKHLVIYDLDKPMGICVYPQKGYMYWGDMGAEPRIERARLDGSERTALVINDLDHPRGLSLDITHEHLYWLDDFRDTINRLDLNTMSRTQFPLSTVAPNQHNTLFGISVYQDFIFVTDQTYNHLKIYNRTQETLIRNIPLLDLPYDVMMYDQTLQEDSANDCPTMGCQHMCISMGQGRGKCICAQHYLLSPADGKSCTRDQSLAQPSFLYTIGRSLCGSRIEIADRQDVHPGDDIECFYTNVTEARALAIHAEAEELFYSDITERTVNRVRLIGDWKKDTIAAQTGEVKGMCVDWLTNNLYWTDETQGHIYVSRTDGRYPLLLLDQNIGMPRGIALDPIKGYMFWTDANTHKIFRANMDGTGIEMFHHDMSEPEGLSLDLREGRLYWTEDYGVYSVNEEGSDQRTLVTSLTGDFRSVTVFQMAYQPKNIRRNGKVVSLTTKSLMAPEVAMTKVLDAVGGYLVDYFAYTDGASSIYYGSKSTAEDPRPVQHIDSTVSHDIISYSDYIQPTENPGKCEDPSMRCQQLCLPKSTGYTCACAYGFQLAGDGYSCESQLTELSFLLFVDPYQRQIYQLDLTLSNANPQGIPIPTPEFPSIIDVDAIAKEVFWLDESARVIKKTDILGGHEEVVVVVPENHVITSFAVSSLTREILYSDGYLNVILRNTLSRGEERVFAQSSVATKMLVDEYSSYVYWSEDTPTHAIYRQHLTDMNVILPVVSSPRAITGLALDKTNQRLYWCTANQIMWSNLDGSEKTTLTTDQNGNFNSLAVTPDYIYFSHWDKKALYRRSHSNQQVNAVTDEFFSRIHDIKDYSWIAPGSNFTEIPMMQHASGANLIVVIGIVAGVVGLLLLVLIIAIVIWRMNRRKLSPDDFQTEAHDNPTYATTTVIPDPDPIYHTLASGGRPPSSGSRDSDLPDVVKLPFPEDELPGGALGAGVNPPDKDTEHLVKPSEVLLNMQGGVMFKPKA